MSDDDRGGRMSTASGWIVTSPNSKTGAVCTHGQLARQCQLCEKDAEIERLRKEVEELKKQVEYLLSEE